MIEQSIVEKFAEYVASLPQKESKAVTRRIVGAHLEKYAGTIFAHSGGTDLKRLENLGDVVIDTVTRAEPAASFGFCCGMGITMTAMAIELFSNEDLFPQDEETVLRNLPKLKEAYGILLCMSDGQESAKDVLTAAEKL